MDAIVLAAGEGSRFFATDFEKRPLPAGLEYPIPKALYPVVVPKAGQVQVPVLQHLVKALQEGGAEAVWIATGHLGKKVGTFVSTALARPDVHVIPPHPSIDYRKGPLYTIAGTLDYLNDQGVLAGKDFDKMVMISPADLVIDRRAVWYLAGIPSRGMMASRSRVHVIIENRLEKHDGRTYTAVRDIVPPRFHHLFDASRLHCPVVPLMAVHLDILTSAIAGIGKGYTRFSEVLNDWLETNIRDDHEFRSDVHVIPSTNLGESFYWHDLDTQDAVRDMETNA